jgi:hypothetical protein
MNPIAPVTTLCKAVTLPFAALFVIGLTGFINWFTSPGHWWFQWVAFGMAIAALATWFRAAKVLAGIGVAAGVGYILYRLGKRAPPTAG